MRRKGPKESVVMREVELALQVSKFYVVPRGARVWPYVDKSMYKGLIWRNNVGAVRIGRRFVNFGVPGLPDYVGWIFATGKMIAIEVKTDVGTLNINQKNCASLMDGTHVITFVARSFDDCLKHLSKVRFDGSE